MPLTTPSAIPSISAAANRRQKPDRSLVSALWLVSAIIRAHPDT